MISPMFEKHKHRGIRIPFESRYFLFSFSFFFFFYLSSDFTPVEYSISPFGLREKQASQSFVTGYLLYPVLVFFNRVNKSFDSIISDRTLSLSQRGKEKSAKSFLFFILVQLKSFGSRYVRGLNRSESGLNAAGVSLPTSHPQRPSL